MFSLKIQDAKLKDHTQFTKAILGQQGHHVDDGQRVGRGWRPEGQHKSRNNKFRPTLSSRGPRRGGRCRKTIPDAAKVVACETSSKGTPPKVTVP